MDFGLVWTLFITAVVFLGFSMMRRVNEMKKAQQKAREKYLSDKEKYRTLTSEMIDSLPVNELTHAVLFHIINKEDTIYEGDSIDERTLFDILSEGEKLMYTIYQVEVSTDSGKGSIHSFFVEDTYAPYRDYVDTAFRTVNCFEIADLMKAATRLAQIIEEDLEDEENDIEGDYATYNFADYTRELLSLLKSSGIVEKAGKYIQEHKEQFISQDIEIKEENINEVRSEENGEGISDEV
jgi:hypothetical protein